MGSVVSTVDEAITELSASILVFFKLAASIATPWLYCALAQSQVGITNSQFWGVTLAVLRDRD